jgi:hypothetical protein
MMGHSATQTTGKIRCPIHLFEPQEVKIEALTKSINAAGTASEKMPFVHELISEVNVLLECGSYDRDNPNCCLCRNFSQLRRQTADVIACAGALAGGR